MNASASASASASAIIVVIAIVFYIVALLFGCDEIIKHSSSEARGYPLLEDKLYH